MANTPIVPEKITRPFQLMAAWFAMLVLLVSILLTAAAKITHPDWAAGYLIVFSSVVVLLVIGCVLLMLTKFRPNLQEGREYAAWLKDQNTYSSGYVVKQKAVQRTTQGQAKRSASGRGAETTKKAFLTSVLDVVDSQELVESLKNNGFNAEVYREPLRSGQAPVDTLEKNEGIWIGYRIDARAAIKVIKLAVTHWPDLKYLHLSTDGGDPPDYVHDQMFLGGSSTTARRYGLRGWSNDELLGLDENMTSEAFHTAIRARYS